MQLTFLGAAGTVTGSKTLLETGSHRVLVDCGMYQGFKQLRLRNRERFPVPPDSIDAVVLTHAHIDHSGYLPVLVKSGFRGPIYCTAATGDLVRILLPDSGFIQEEEARRANKHGYTRHQPAVPLYTAEEANDCLKYLERIPLETDQQIVPGLTLRLINAGHILGAAMARITHQGRTVHFTGDLGRPVDPILEPPTSVEHADVLVCESTYGARAHPDSDPEAELGAIVGRTLGRGGHVLIPSFAVGRTQRILWHLRRLRRAGSIPEVPVYLNSPLASAATELYLKHVDDPELADAVRAVKVVSSVEESIALNHLDTPSIIIAGSGMATGGRITHHIRSYGPHARHSIVFVGWQADGTRGAQLLSGAGEVKIFGTYVPVNAEVASVHGLSAHADGDEIMAWLQRFERAPSMTFLNHGSELALDTLRRRVEETLGWTVHVPWYLDKREV